MTIRIDIPEAELKALEAKIAKLPLLSQSEPMIAGLRSAGNAVKGAWRKKIPIRPSVAGKEIGVFRRALKVIVKEYGTARVAIVGARHSKAPHQWLLEFGHEMHIPKAVWSDGGGFKSRIGTETVHVGRVEPKGYGEAAADETRVAQVIALRTGAAKAIAKALS